MVLTHIRVSRQIGTNVTSVRRKNATLSKLVSSWNSLSKPSSRSAINLIERLPEPAYYEKKISASLALLLLALAVYFVVTGHFTLAASPSYAQEAKLTIGVAACNYRVM